MMDEQPKRRTMIGFLLGIVTATAVGSFIGTIRHNTMVGFVLAVALDLIVALIFFSPLSQR